MLCSNQLSYITKQARNYAVFVKSCQEKQDFAPNFWQKL
ncbi:hypothetical protein CAter282_3609 [Collimonas arenae]|uniref:Uncharacterized protein n=1 Tax=Collimonas arenae TaxID=279058 RepID=A0A127QMK3_9BURK|nr:hypothetical protein CAter10_3948 [Collimonas arenae]AMP11293.1 hypothetical protein CAter282_3609 [Collimonas arenae]